jgi:hypothetical protein
MKEEISNPQPPKPISIPVVPKSGMAPVPLPPSALRPTAAAIKPAAPSGISAPKLPLPTAIAAQAKQTAQVKPIAQPKPAALLKHKPETLVPPTPAQKPSAAVLREPKWETAQDSLNVTLLIIAMIVGLAALGIQVWTLLY